MSARSDKFLYDLEVKRKSEEARNPGSGKALVDDVKAKGEKLRHGERNASYKPAVKSNVDWKATAAKKLMDKSTRPVGKFDPAKASFLKPKGRVK